MAVRSQSAPRKILYICDWLPPDFGAVGQYGLLSARRLAENGAEVVLGGLSSKGSSETCERHGDGALKIIRLSAAPYRKDRLAERLLWTVRTNTRLVGRLLHAMRWADDVLITGSPPMLLHWIAPLNVLLRKRLIYRITDFHPECLMAARGRRSAPLSIVYRLTLFWRRRVDAFEVLGHDQRRRLEDIGIPAERIRIERDSSPVPIPPCTPALPRPDSSKGKVLLLYSGNWGVAHDHQTFIEAYRLHHQEGTGRVVLWLNALGTKARVVADALSGLGLPLARGTPLPLDQLAQLLVTPDAHLITLSDSFVGFALPSKVYGCIASRKPILFVGSAGSDVHLLCSEGVESCYQRVDVGDVETCVSSLERLADFVEAGKSRELRDGSHSEPGFV
jgi:hypothetical protein